MTEENKEGIVTSESSKSKIEFVERELDELELKDKKLMLLDCEINKDKTDLSLQEMEAQLDAKIPLLFLRDDIKSLEEDIKNKVKKSDDGVTKIPATDADLTYMGIRLKYLKLSEEKDIPMRELRLSIHSLRHNKTMPDAKENQIKKLVEEIRNKKETTLKHRVEKDVPIGVG